MNIVHLSLQSILPTFLVLCPFLYKVTVGTRGQKSSRNPRRGQNPRTWSPTLTETSLQIRASE